MDFFAQQEKARRNTFYLVFLYLLSIIGIIAVIYLILLVYLTHGKVNEIVQYCSNYNFHNQFCDQLFHLKTLATIASGVFVVVFLGSIWKLIALSRGGTYVAQSLGGRLVDRNTGDPLEKRLLNIVEEMSIASGISVPDTYIMSNEGAINAFAAGYSPKDAVVAVTRGCLEKLNREELQGVIGHEFSHILNGDMRLNIRLIAILNGILCISLIGRILMQFRSRTSYRSSNDRENKNPLAALPLIGFVLWIVGYLGVFFGHLIKSAVSRQREFLADASSVQFTRNPDGLASALKKIGGYTDGSKLASAKAEEASHMFFANGLSNFWFSLLATHPPLPERIKRLEPEFVEQSSKTREIGEERAYAGFAEREQLVTSEINQENVSSKIGSLNKGNLNSAADLIKNIPPQLKQAVNEVGPALAMLMSMMLSSEEKFRVKQFERIADQTLLSLIKEYQPKIKNIKRESYLPVVELLLPTLRLLPKNYLENVISDLRFLSEVDQELTLFEYVLVIIVQAATRQVRGEKLPGVSFYRITDLGKELQLILSALSYSGSGEQQEVLASFSLAVSFLGLNVNLAPKQDCTLQNIDNALTQLEKASMELKKKIVQACTSCVERDLKVTLEETELLRAVCYLLDCPLSL